MCFWVILDVAIREEVFKVENHFFLQSQYQPSGTGGTRSQSATAHRLTMIWNDSKTVKTPKNKNFRILLKVTFLAAKQQLYSLES